MNNGMSYKALAHSLNREGGAFLDDEYERLAAQDEIDALYFGGERMEEKQHG